MTNKSKLTEILRDAVSDYSAHAGEKSPVEWLQGYLGEKLPDKSLDKIHSISSESNPHSRPYGREESCYE